MGSVKRHRAAILLIAACALHMGATAGNNPSFESCVIVDITDGDTIKARCGPPGEYKQITVRLGAIDAPERKQAFGSRSQQALSDIAFDKTADLLCKKNDRYDRSVCTVKVAPASAPDGPRTLDAGLAMVTLGMAWWYRAYSREQMPQERGQYEFAEVEAKAKRVGLWADPEPVPPWEWRKKGISK